MAGTPGAEHIAGLPPVTATGSLCCAQKPQTMREKAMEKFKPGRLRISQEDKAQQLAAQSKVYMLLITIVSLARALEACGALEEAARGLANAEARRRGGR